MNESCSVVFPVCAQWSAPNLTCFRPNAGGPLGSQRFCWSSHEFKVFICLDVSGLDNSFWFNLGARAWLWENMFRKTYCPTLISWLDNAELLQNCTGGLAASSDPETNSDDEEFWRDSFSDVRLERISLEAARFRQNQFYHDWVVLEEQWNYEKQTQTQFIGCKKYMYICSQGSFSDTCCICLRSICWC